MDEERVCEGWCANAQREGAGGVLTCKIKEMCIIKTSQINTCNY